MERGWTRKRRCDVSDEARGLKRLYEFVERSGQQCQDKVGGNCEAWAWSVWCRPEPKRWEDNRKKTWEVHVQYGVCCTLHHWIQGMYRIVQLIDCKYYILYGEMHKNGWFLTPTLTCILWTRPACQHVIVSRTGQSGTRLRFKQKRNLQNCLLSHTRVELWARCATCGPLYSHRLMSYIGHT